MAPHSSTLAWKSHGQRSLVGCSPWGHKGQTRLNDFTFTFHFHALEKEIATHSSVFAWRIPVMAEPDGLLSMGSHRVGHDWRDSSSNRKYSKLQVLTHAVTKAKKSHDALKSSGWRTRKTGGIIQSKFEGLRIRASVSVLDWAQRPIVREVEKMDVSAQAERKKSPLPSPFCSI